MAESLIFRKDSSSSEFKLQFADWLEQAMAESLIFRKDSSSSEFKLQFADWEHQFADWEQQAKA